MWAAAYTGVSAWLPDHPMAALMMGFGVGVLVGVWMMTPKK